MSCWDTGRIRRKLTPALTPAVGFTAGRSFMIHVLIDNMFGLPLHELRFTYKCLFVEC